jgi:hypothetical protein
MSLDKKGRLARQRSDAEEARLDEAEKLNPSFPYRMEAFPFNFFGVDIFVTEEEKPTS